MTTRTVVSVLLMLVAAQARGDQPQTRPEQQLDLGAIVTQVMGNVNLPKPTGDGLPEFKDVTKDMESREGLFTLWFYPAGTKDKDLEQLLCQIPSGFLGRKFMLSTSFSGGGFFTGFPLDERVVQWELLHNQLLLIEPQTQYVVDSKQTVSDVVQRTYPDRIRVAVPLVTKAPDGSPVIDLGALLKSDFADIAWMSVFGGGPMFGSAGINAPLSQWTTKKTFPHNVEIGVALALSRGTPPGSFDKKTVHFSFWALPDSDYQPRLADDRVGYFLTTNQDWSKPTEARDLFNRYIDRWPVVKRDASLHLCEPKQPIVFYIEKTVPVRFRRAVRDGILEWNKAFEKVGFVNAVEVRQQEADNEWRDLDPEDMRYSFFRWIVTGAGFAMGPHRANPFTGEIYDADIIFDDSMVRYFEQSAEQMLPAAAVSRKLQDPALQDFLKDHPEWRRPPLSERGFMYGDTEDGALRQAMLERMRSRGRHCCDYVQGMRHQMAVAGAVLAEAPKEVKEQFLYDVIKEVVMHEVGHTLGLRHNFKASSLYPLEEIRKRRVSGEPTVGSVMDYNPVLFTSQGIAEGHFITPTIGPYDYWAIEYGYRPADGYKKAESPADSNQTEPQQPPTDKPQQAAHTQIHVGGGETLDTSRVEIMIEQLPPEVLQQLPPEIRQLIEAGDTHKLAGMAQAVMSGGGPTPTPTAVKPQASGFKAPPSGEAAMLTDIASRAAEPELVYATDEDTTFVGIDPLSNRFDMGSDPIEWAEDRITLVNNRLASILDWAVKDQESWYHMCQAFISLMIEKAMILDYVGRLIGGQYFSRDHRGDPDAAAPFVLVEPERQRQAMSFIENNLFSDEFFKLDPKVLNHLAPSRWWHEGTYISFTMDFPVHEYIAMLQWWNLFDRLFPNTLRRIHDAELKSAATDKFTVAEYLQRIQKACWADALDSKRAKQGSWNDQNPFVSDIRRSLQREYLNLMEPLVRSKPGIVLSPDLHAMVRFSLSNLQPQIDAVLSTQKLDFASEAHLEACKSRIQRMLAPELKEYEWSPMTGMF